MSRSVKVIRITHGLFGTANTWRIERSITKWTKKGYELQQQNDRRGWFLNPGYTLLTFVKPK